MDFNNHAHVKSSQSVLFFIIILVKMISYLVVMAALGTSPVLSAAVEGNSTLCWGSSNHSLALFRTKRQSNCRRDQWRCRDGSCISFDGKCDGVVNCADRSDETHALCMRWPCQYNWFRCTYGACVDGTAPCNGVQDCADNSDELLPRCRNESGDVSGQFKCQDGSSIPASNHCDGVADCPDGSDETVRACAAKSCPSYLFQCAYGACVDQGSDCNGKRDCADGSDEDAELCNRLGPIETTTPLITSITTTTTTSTTTTAVPPKSGTCLLPNYPDHGRYTVANAPTAVPGQALEFVDIKFSCNVGYGVVGDSSLTCYNGWWTGDFPTCSRFCRLKPDESVRYICRPVGGPSTQGFRDCEEYEPSGTVVRPECQAPIYYSPIILRRMTCIEGSWDYIATCVPECGQVTPSGTELVFGGRYVYRGELPWHAGIYMTTTKQYRLICGGSIVSSSVVISAAHCFWNAQLEKAHPPSDYAVAVGKIYREWNNPLDTGAQQFNVTDIKVPQRFRGRDANFQDDIAILKLATPIKFKSYVRPVCVDFDFIFDSQQLRPGKAGKVAGWGFTTEQGNASQILKVVDMPFIDIPECVARSSLDFRQFITSDKICAGYWNGTALCRGDSGGGLAFLGLERGTERFYLRGVVSAAAKDDINLCNPFAPTAFTQLIKHEHFIKEYL